MATMLGRLAIPGWPTDIVMGSYYGYDPVPAAVGKWIKLLAAAHDSNLPPAGGPAPEPRTKSNAGNH